MSVNPTGSYLQVNRHANVTEKFNVIQPASVGEAMQAHGLNIVSLSTGKAKHADKVDFQRTLSRYRGPEIAEGVFLDVVYDSRHMGRGVDKILIGIYRMICTNGLFAGTNFFKFGVRHNGPTYENLNQGIAAALKMQDKLASLVGKMQQTQLTHTQKAWLADEAAKLLTPDNAANVRHTLLKARRELDQGQDLWTVFNVIQENAMAGKSVAYSLARVEELTGRSVVRNMLARGIKPNTGKDADFNGKLFELAEKLAA